MRELLKRWDGTRRAIGAMPAALALALLLLGGCRDGADTPQPGQPTEADLQAQGYVPMNGYLVPPREISDPTLPDSCALLTEAAPGELIGEPLAPIQRMSNVCIASALSDPTLNHSIAVEVRHPEPFEVEAGLPKDLESFWTAEGGGLDLFGARREELEEVPGLGDYAVWYPIEFGLGLHAYAQGQYIIRLTIRGIDMERSRTLAKAVAQRAVEAAGALGQTPATAAQ